MGERENGFGLVDFVFATEGHASTQKEGPKGKESLEHVKDKESN